MNDFRSSDRSRYMVRLDRGEEVIQTLADFVRGEGLRGGGITGIGAVEQVVLGYFDRTRREYSRRQLEGELELVSFVGNLAWSDGVVVIHAHAAVSGPELTVVGGHLFSATICVTGEFLITTLGQDLMRSVDPATGLKLLC